MIPLKKEKKKATHTPEKQNQPTNQNKQTNTLPSLSRVTSLYTPMKKNHKEIRLF